MYDDPEKEHLVQQQEALFWNVVESDEYKKRFEGFRALSRRKNKLILEHSNPKIRNLLEYYSVSNLKLEIKNIEKIAEYYRKQSSKSRSWSDKEKLRQRLENNWSEEGERNFFTQYEDMKEYAEDIKDWLEQVAWVRRKMGLEEG